MDYQLSKDNANKITTISKSQVVVLPSNVFNQGDMLMMFNNSDNFICLESKVENTYISGRKEKRTMIEWPPRSLLNVVFVESNLAVAKVEL
jgi:hypothetical protein